MLAWRILPGAFRWLSTALALLFAASSGGAATLPQDFVLETYATGLDKPVALRFASNGLLYVNEKGGKVRVIQNDVLLPTPFIDLEDRVNTRSDRGLLGIALHPDFPSTAHVYLLYTYDPPETQTQSGASAPDEVGQRVARLIRVTADVNTGYTTAVPGSEVVILGSASTWANIGDPTAEQTDTTAPRSCGSAGAFVADCIPNDGLSHAIGSVEFGPDGMLYVGNGDSATWTTVDPGALRSLDPDSLSGKILRVDPNTGLGLPDNPFWDGDPGSNRSRVWQLGLRNPYRFRLHPTTGDVWIADVGWNDWEEINRGVAGADFGWPCYEGEDGVLLQQPGYAALSECQTYYASNSAVAPVHAYPHQPGLGGAAVAGEIYQATKWPAPYHDQILLTDYALQTVSTVDVDGDPLTVTPFATDLLSVDLAVGPDGDVYSANVLSGEIERIVFVGVGGPSGVADFADDFAGPSPATGWAYLWNAGGAMGDPANEVALVWDTLSLYDSDGVSGLPDASGMRNGFVGASMMRPGMSVADGEGHDRFAIARYTVNTSGYYELGNTHAFHTGCGASDGVELKLLVDGMVVHSDLIGQGSIHFFDEDLGYVQAGSSIAVALGPNASDVCDDTEIDWEVFFTPGSPPVGSPPTATVTAPVPTTLWSVNDVVAFGGSATDPEDGALTGSALSWEGLIRHNTHQHPDLLFASGSSGSFVYPDHGDDSYVEVCLTATDSDGNRDTACVDARPDLSSYTFDSVPSALSLTYNGESLTTQFVVDVPMGGLRQISAPWLQGSFVFDSWSIGGQSTRQITIAGDQTIVASYAQLSGPPLQLAKAVATDSDDAEEDDSGTVDVGSSDLELTREASDQLVGVRFDGIDIEHDALIASAYLQFTTDETDSEATSLIIECEASDDAATFMEADFDVSARPRTNASISWSPSAWSTLGEAGPAQQTPDLAEIVAEIVKRPGWQTGNALAFLISGTGKRVADSFDGGSGAPVLHVSFTNPNGVPVVSLAAPSNLATFTEGDSIAFSATATDPEEGDLTASLVWSSDLDGGIGTGSGFNTALNVGTHVITASAIDSWGLPGQAQVTITVNVNVAPSVNLGAPTDLAMFTEGESIAFAASATDPEDGDLTASLVWSSDLDGAIGTGGAFNAVLGVGVHAITAAVTDGGGLPGQAQVTITVDANTAPSVNIDTPDHMATFTDKVFVSFVGSASDVEDGDLTTSLGWSSDLDGVIGAGGGFTTMLSVGVHQITAMVTDGQGLPGSAVISLDITRGQASFCGLGVELAVLIPLLGWARRRVRRPGSA